MSNPFSLEGKSILVTGASSGIGREVALTLNRCGAKLIINGRNLERLQAVADEINSMDTIVVCGDLTSEVTIRDIIERIPSVHGVVHAAGLLRLLPFRFISSESLGEMMEVNFFGPTYLSLALARNRKLVQGASLVYITSINGTAVGSKANSMYAASKGALLGMIKAMAIDLAKNKIRVNSVAPGMITTEGAANIAEHVTEQSISEDVKKYPLGRYGVPADVANACVYLLADASSWVTGTSMVVDGGFTIQ